MYMYMYMYAYYMCMYAVIGTRPNLPYTESMVPKTKRGLTNRANVHTPM